MEELRCGFGLLLRGCPVFLWLRMGWVKSKSTKIPEGTRWGWTGNTSILCFLCALWQNKASWEGLNPQMHQAMGGVISIYNSTHLFWRIEDRGLQSLSYKRSGGDDVFRQLAGLVAKSAEVALHLNAMPKVWGLVKKRSKANRHGRGDGAFTQYNFVDGTWSHTNGPGHRILRDTHGLQVFFEQDFAGRDGSIHDYNV